MPSKKKKAPPRPIFDSIRKPLAPPSRKIGKNKPEEKIHPTNRKGKYKQEEDLEN
ncbi:MAG: hypothetical protein ABIP06_05985 [Pyrinomonadaceae bacterium]